MSPFRLEHHFGKMSSNILDGQNTYDNTQLSSTAALVHEFQTCNFEKVRLGPALSYEAFENNHKFAIYGDGGYFNPREFFKGVLQLQFLTKERRCWLAAGSGGVGWQVNAVKCAVFSFES